MVLMAQEEPGATTTAKANSDDPADDAAANVDVLRLDFRWKRRRRSADRKVAVQRVAVRLMAVA